MRLYGHLSTVEIAHAFRTVSGRPVSQNQLTTAVEILPGTENTNYINSPFFLQEISADLNHTAENLGSHK